MKKTIFLPDGQFKAALISSPEAFALADKTAAELGYFTKADFGELYDQMIVQKYSQIQNNGRKKYLTVTVKN